ncbi:hypothetical protein N866_10710 [Actinotalea ferrariae CF5-4]|uniref:OmpR/PhoB-type domain-containing protein n=2 Tax=Actinotalea TaxID=458839 RepID=A0A021VT16_9CELL|nr:hypothetical protein N866_10710 [Actinotalea ferrariae CF5-4]
MPPGLTTGAPAFALHVTIDPEAGPAATALLAEIARRVLMAVEEAGPMARSRSLLAVTPSGRLSRAVSRVGEELAAAELPASSRPGDAATRAGAAWSVPTQALRPVVELTATERTTGHAGIPHVAALVLDVDAREVTRDGVVVPMTHKELGLLEHLLRNPHRAVPRDELLREVWRKNVTARTTRTIDVHVRRLREKLGGCLRIVTVRGVGYRWDPTPDVVLVGSGDAD